MDKIGINSAEFVFTTVVIAVFLILTAWGNAAALVAASAIGLIVGFFLFRGRLQKRSLVAGSAQLGYSDFVLWLRHIRVPGGHGSIEARRMLEIKNSQTRTFFDRYLKGIETSDLHHVGAGYPEVEFRELPREEAVAAHTLRIESP